VTVHISPSNDFGELYRKAFAENDPKKKLVLLHEVQRAICDWEQSDCRTENNRDPERDAQRAAS
jgi:hypothetical protein